MSPQPDLRAGDADRKQVIAELQQHYVDGRLTADELGERVTQATAARTFGELAQVLSDLPRLGSEMTSPVRQSRTDLLGGVPLGAVILAVGLVLMLAMLVMQGGGFGGYGMHSMPFWPLFIFGFFVFGRSRRR
jgi:uncharacterized protein DUF1707